MADLVKLVCTMPRTNASGTVISTNVLPGGEASGTGVDAAEARANLKAALEARATANSDAAGVLSGVASGL